VKVLIIDLNQESFQEKEFGYKGTLELGIDLHHQNKTYNKSLESSENLLVLGTGPFNFGGAHRGVFVFRSPLHGGLHSSTLGDVGTYLKKAGYQALVIQGRVKKPHFLMVKNGEIKLKESKFTSNIFDQEKILYKQIKSWYGEENYRICLTGQLAQKLPYGAVLSSKPDQLGIGFSAAGRGGSGSVLAQAHGLVGISIGGSKKVSQENFPAKSQKVLEETEKYRQQGTFKSNFSTFKENLIAFNWTNFQYDPDQRNQFHRQYVLNQFLKELDLDCETCGEQCPAACRKLEKGQRVDYETFQGVGPFLGIFNRQLARKLDYKVDILAVDAIYVGFVFGAIMEAGAKGKIDLEKQFGIDQKPVWDLDKFDQKSSEINYQAALQLFDQLADNDLFHQRLSSMVKKLGIEEEAFYMDYGQEFDMVPNFYWSLGLVLPIIMPGKYFSDYSSQVASPEKYGRFCAQKTKREFILDDLGICRFQRKWLDLEKIVPDGYWTRANKNMKKLVSYRQKADAVQNFWASDKLKQSMNKLITESGREYYLETYWRKWKKSYNKNLNI